MAEWNGRGQRKPITAAEDVGHDEDFSREDILKYNIISEEDYIKLEETKQRLEDDKERKINMRDTTFGKKMTNRERKAYEKQQKWYFENPNLNCKIYQVFY